MKRVMASALYNNVDPFALMDSKLVRKPSDLTLDCVLLLHGGADISPSIYGQQPNDYCYADRTPDGRDLAELALIEQARKMGLPIVGLCRGAQLLCAVDGGTLVQHITNHSSSGNHSIRDTRVPDKYYKSNSAHHQMMQPLAGVGNIVLADIQQDVVGYGENNICKIYNSCPEIVYFPRLRAIGIQGHPEWMPGSIFTQYCASLIKEFLLED